MDAISTDQASRKNQAHHDARAARRIVFAIRDFRLYLASRFLWGLGLHIQTIAIAWLVYELTRDPFALGLIGLFAFIPAVPLSIVTGPVADRYDRRLILIGCNIAMAFAAFAVIAMLAGGFIGAHRVWPLYVAVLVFGASRAFSGPAGQALVMGLIPREQYSVAAAWNNTVNQSATIIGPALGGLLFPFGQLVPFITSALALTISAALTLLIATRRAAGGRPPVTWAMIVAGYGFIWRTPVILGTITLDLVAVLLGGATALLPIFARDIFETGPWGLGLLRSMPAVGSLCAALVLAWFPLRWHIGRTMFASVMIYGLATIVFALSPHIWVGMAALAVIGMADMVSVVIRQTLIQVETPDEMRGRVIAVHSILTGTSNHLGEFESGALAWFIGPVATVLFGGVSAIFTSLLWMRLFPQLRDRARLS